MNLLFPNFDRVGSDTFSTSYKCYSVSFFPGNLRDGVEKGGKSRFHLSWRLIFLLVIMPPSTLGALNAQKSYARGRRPCLRIKCFSESGIIRQVPAADGGFFGYIQPKSCVSVLLFLTQSSLENALRDFACLTVGDVIAINYNDNVYELKVLETKPDNAVTIIECDMSHDEDENVVIPDTAHKFQAFCGTGHRLDGKGKTPISPSGSGSSESTSLVRER
ncbi:Ubiquitin fusion degradation protein 1 [Fasciolopsis buskii]|uniref:Ubiquitin fusion degradation protein 1 n=1 Tax=Fasciolopsis buskii TaxID=27845 RepID=A0A8E0RXH7_9TREM|nr:Ubiquitin fusion degradation protein 1 [Fasciolopsis buski]